MAQPTKADLREEFLAKRNALDPGERKRWSSLIRQRIFEHAAWKNASTVLCYVSFGTEVETHTLIQEALRFKKRVFVPLYKPHSTETLISELRRFGELAPGPKPNVLEPASEFIRLADPTEVELALVPGTVFDREGGRLGFGGGHFDRLMARMPKAVRIGIGFSVQISSTPLPLESYDVRLHAIITEKEILVPSPQPSPARRAGEGKADRETGTRHTTGGPA